MLLAEQPRLADPSWDGVWIVIPAYNEARTIRVLAQDALAQCSRVIVVDDGSRDGTAEQLEGLPITVLAHQTNQGKAASLRTAFTYALERDAQCAISIDGDGQHCLSDAAGLLNVWSVHRQHIAIGSRLHDRAQFPPARYRANKFACFWISWAAGHPIADSQSGFRAYPREVMQLALTRKVQSHRFTFESEILIVAAHHGHPTVAMAIPSSYPLNARPSHFRPVADIAKIVVMVAGKLLKQGMAPLGLWRSVKTAKVLPGRAVVKKKPNATNAGDVAGKATLQ